MNRWSAQTKTQAVSLAKRGLSYSQIQARTGVPKSTLSLWLSPGSKPLDPNRQRRHLQKARRIAIEVLRQRKRERINTAILIAQSTVATLSLDEINIAKALLAMLYWAEGGKQDGNMKFTNTDPDLAFLFLALLRQAYQIDESRIRVALQIHAYHDRARVIRFWSKKLSVPQAQFWKPYLKQRGGGKNYRRNFAGICNVHYASSAIQRELLAIGSEISKKLS